MSFDGNGTFSRIMNWVSDAAAGIKIKADRHDQQDDDFAAGLSNCITKDGQTQPTANIPMNGKKIVNLADPVDVEDAANKKYVDAIKTFATGLEISGADANGRLKFISPTGANGLAFTGADLSWLARLADASATPPTKNRLVLNDKPDGSGADVVVVNDDGTIVAKGLTASPTITVKAASGNVHFWLKGPNDEDRAVLYTQADAEGPTTLRLKGSVNFNFLINGQFKAPAAVYAGNAYLNTDGNIGGGSVWANWGHSDAFNAIQARIEARAQAWANDRVANLAYRKVSQTYNNSTANFICPAGAVLTGYNREGGLEGEVYGVYYAYLQAYDPVRGWVGFSG